MKKLGIIKGGQLGRMLIEAAPGFEVSTHVLESDPQAPCAKICDRFVVGSSLDEEAVFGFGQSVDVLTFEFENINLRALERLEEQGHAVYPGSAVMRIARDKGMQKEFFRRHRIPTADFVLIGGRADAGRAASIMPCVQKTRIAGYDGLGVQRVDSLDDRALLWDLPSVMEKLIDFQTELSVIVARGRDGAMAVYPACQMVAHPDRPLLDRLICPARVPAAVADQAEAISRRVAEQMGMVGVLAVEMFVTREDEVLVNEISPRPHNSGHHTIDSNRTSQYAQHLRCVLGLPLGPTDLIRPAVMINLVGEPGFTGPPVYRGLEEVKRTDGVYVNLYGKAVTRPYRKMGHITVLGTDLQSAEEKAKWVKSKVQVLA